MGGRRAEERLQSMDFTARRPGLLTKLCGHFWQSLNRSFYKMGGGDGGGDGEGEVEGEKRREWKRKERKKEDEREGRRPPNSKGCCEV